MNIAEAYIKFRKQLIILVSGLDGSGKTQIGQMVADDFKIEHLKLSSYIFEEFNETTTLPNGEKVVNHYQNEAYDWDRLSNDVDKKQSTGVVVSGFGFPKEHLGFKSDYHLHLAVSKKVSMDRMKQKIGDDYDEGKELMMMNKLQFPYYLKTKEEATINKFVNVNNVSSVIEAYDLVFDLIIKMIEGYLYRDQQKNSGYGGQDTNSSSDDSSSSSSDDDETASVGSSIIASASSESPSTASSVSTNSSDSDSSDTDSSSDDRPIFVTDSDGMPTQMAPVAGSDSTDSDLTPEGMFVNPNDHGMGNGMFGYF